MRGLRRVAGPVSRFILLLFAVSIATFLMLELIPGSVIDVVLPNGATPEQITAARLQFGLDDPLYMRYLHWLGAILHGDLGRSFVSNREVGGMLLERAPVSLELASLSMLVALAFSIPVGVWSAYRPGGIVDRASTALISATLATPSFVLGIVLVYVLGVRLRMLPILGWTPFSEDPVDHFRRLVMPVLTLAAGVCVLFTRLLKGDMMATLQQDHVLSARARGLPTWRILVKHALRQSSFSLITVSGVVIGQLIGGTVIVESIFSLPGLGTTVVTAINSRDYIVVQAVVLISATVYLLINTLVDLSYPLLDPRLRKARTSTRA
jgi:peptide/nickel transport system permease protein